MNRDQSHANLVMQLKIEALRAIAALHHEVGIGGEEKDIRCRIGEAMIAVWRYVGMR
jgi:hypothetical protein